MIFPFIRFARLTLVAVLVIAASLTPAGFAQDKLSPHLSDTIKQIETNEPAYGQELRRLANEVPGVREALEAVVDGGASPDKVANLRKWDHVLPRAFENAGNDLETFKKRWPLIVRRSAVLCALRDENGVPHLVYCFGGDVPTAPKEILEILCTFSPTGETGSMFQTDSEADRWAIEPGKEGKGDVLVLIRQHGVYREAMTMTVRLQKLRIDKNGSFKLIEDKTATFPWPPEQPDDGTYTVAYPGFKYPERYDPKASAPPPAGMEKAPPASAFVVPRPQPTAVPSAERSPTPPNKVSDQGDTSIRWALVVAIIAAGAGILWWMLKRRS